MEKVRYMISDAANLVHVEAHVLRYWEEELELAVPRNEMGHRYYTRENIQEFQKIKDLKEKGYQLKAIRMILHSGEADWDPVSGMGGHTEQDKQSESLVMPTAQKQAQPPKNPVLPASQEEASVMEPEYQRVTSPEDRMEQFRELMSDIVGHAIALNNEELSQNISKEVGEQVLKEMNYLAREQDEAQEERYKKLDAAIRGNIRRKKPIFSKEKANKPEKKLSRKEKKKVAELPKPVTT